MGRPYILTTPRGRVILRIADAETLVVVDETVENTVSNAANLGETTGTLWTSPGSKKDLQASPRKPLRSTFRTDRNLSRHHNGDRLRRKLLEPAGIGQPVFARIADAVTGFRKTIAPE
jgi:hypothetical protein